MCVAHEFFRDDNLNPECLDRTDESQLMDNFYRRYHDFCASDPSFRCEEHTCKISAEYPAPYSCSDGHCLRHKFDTCANRRNHPLLKFDTHAERDSLCWIAMACHTKFVTAQMKTLHEKWCRNLTYTTSQKIIEEQCPPLFEFPIDLLTLGHVRFFYNNNCGDVSAKYVQVTNVRLLQPGTMSLLECYGASANTQERIADVPTLEWLAGYSKSLQLVNAHPSNSKTFLALL